MKKVVFLIVLILSLVITLLAACDYSCKFSENGMDYWCWNGGVLVMGFSEGNSVKDLYISGKVQKSERYFLDAIYSGAFENSNIETLEIEYYVINIDMFGNSGTFTFNSVNNAAFKNCKQLREVKLPYGTKEIWQEAFYGCEVLPSITLPYSLEKLEELAFANCSQLAEVYVDEKLTVIKKGAFNNCLDSLTVYLKCAPPQVDGEIFENVTKLSLQVLPEHINAYKSDAYWSKYADNIIVLDNN